ncbi:STAS domain-containing protein [Aquibium microcysteis]|uniref:STAS domain-containing protein n=1 Tax=Aquibium microcysteis TaxID=675281 RepID=UPI00165CFC9B|nr:STAS domain-containing protein [Aquibium microcysteis]
MDARHVIHWKGHLTIRDGSRSARDFLEALSTGNEVTVDTRELQSVDVCHLQILVAAHNFARCLGKRMDVLVPPGGALDEVMGKVGLADPLDASLLRSGGTWTGIAHDERNAA